MPRCHALMLACCLTMTAALRAQSLEPIAAPAEKPPIYTRQTLFSIPFQIEKAKPDQRPPTDVQLSVSADRGASWQIASKVKPEQGNFVFRAPRDGEYWFSIRTLDGQQPVVSAAPVKPELIVVVDTVPPRLDVTATKDSGGAVTIAWKSVDPYLHAESIKVEVQASEIAPWETLAIDRETLLTGKHTLSGQATWWPKAGSDSVKVRATIGDQASNSTVRQADPQAALASGDGSPSLAAGDSSITNEPRPAATTQQVSASGSRREQSGSTNGSQSWPATSASGDPFLRHQHELHPRTHAVSASTSKESAPSDWRSSSSPATLEQRSGLEPPRDQQLDQQVADRVKRIDLTAPSRLDLSLLPPGEKPRMVSSRSFDLEYEIDSVGPSGISKVELWFTRDGGKSWSALTSDNDNRSPLPVTVEAEAIYGFRIVFTSGNGISGVTPSPGDEPEFWVGVDLTRPVAKIIDVTPGADAGELVIRWQASDELLMSRPIALSYSERATGPWTTIASDLENTGSYAWRIDNRVPERVFVRIETRDEAGNTGIFDSQQPVSLDRQRPQGRIRGIRSAGGAN